MAEWLRPRKPPDISATVPGMKIVNARVCLTHKRFEQLLVTYIIIKIANLKRRVLES
jgi:hypothetical protein